MEKKTNNSNKLEGFIEGKGFYIILTVCLCIIGASGYVLFSEPTQPEYVVEIPKTTTNIPANNDIPNVIVDLEPTTAKPKPTQKPTQPPKRPVSKPTPIAVEEKVYIPPVIGKVSKTFSQGELVFDMTMGDYRTHNGIDIECKNGTAVNCFSDGVVEKIYKDELLGNCVIINHGDGLKSVYKGLSNGITLKVDSNIKAGDVIGSSSSSNLTEAEEVEHIHFEVLKNGKYIDPLTMIK